MLFNSLSPLISNVERAVRNPCHCSEVLCVCLSRGGGGLAGTRVHSNSQVQMGLQLFRAFTCQPPAVRALQPCKRLLKNSDSWSKLTSGSWLMDCSCWQLLAKAAGCRGMLETSRTLSAFSQKMFPEWAGSLSGVAGGCPWPVFLLANVDLVSGCRWILTNKSLWLQRSRVVRGRWLGRCHVHLVWPFACCQHLLPNTTSRFPQWNEASSGLW